MTNPDALYNVIEVEKPVAIWQKPLKLDWQRFFYGAAQAGVGMAQGQVEVALTGLNDALAAIQSEEEKAAALAWVLIFEALQRAMRLLAQENHKLWRLSIRAEDTAVLETRLASVSEQLAHKMMSLKLQISRDFLERPDKLPFLEHFQPLFRDWLLEGFQLELVQANAISRRLPNRFGLSLHHVWMAQAATFAPLQALLEQSSPFIGFAQRQQAWRRYGDYLQTEADKPVFNEAFSLQEVYIDLRAWYPCTTKNADGEEKTLRYVVDLQHTLLEWVAQADADDCFRFIRGGPGAGKSSFAKIFAATVCQQRPELPILFVPLQHLQIEKGLETALNQFVAAEPELKDLSNPLVANSPEDRLLVIFDGLDELAKAGESSTRLASQFVTEVEKTVYQQRGGKVWQVLFCGRDLAVQGIEPNFRQHGQILHLLPYYLDEEQCQAYVDEQQYLQLDQRDSWWQKYWQAVGATDNNTMPPELRGADLPDKTQQRLNDITAQPLLNYLVALALREQDFAITADTSLNLIYDRLFKGVHAREYASQYLSVKNLPLEDFYFLMEEIAITAWQGGDVRATSVTAIQQRCGQALQDYLKNFQQSYDAEVGVTNLLTAFYFKRLDAHYSEQRFEFTHKSFGEYLIARAIVKKLEYINVELQRLKRNPRHQYNVETALADWASLCGQTAVDADLLAFIEDEIAMPDYKDNVADWQQCLIGLLESAINQGMPMEKLDPRPAYAEEHRQARNAEEALLAVLYACASITQQLSKIHWSQPTSFGTWLAKLQGQRAGGENVLAYQCLAWLDLSNQAISMHDLYGANLHNSHLVGIRGYLSIFERANLEGADLEGANLRSANLEGANPEQARNFDKAIR